MYRTAFALLAAAASCAVCQIPTVIQIDIENFAVYYSDNPDYTKLARSQQAVPPASTPTLSSFIGVADIVRVNGKPAKGTFTARGALTNFAPNPQPGQAIADTTRTAVVDWIFEIQQGDGSPVGTIMSTGMGFGPAPPGSPLRLSPSAASSMAITGGTGAFLGIRGQAGLSVSNPARNASVAEDPSIRRTLGGAARSFLLTLIPLAPPAVLNNASGPLALHSSDFSQLSATNSARPGEILTLIMTGLGPTNPGVDPGQPFPANPLAAVNSPLEVRVNGNAAEVLGAVGYPGAVDGYQVNFRLPPDTPKGSATILVGAAWIAGSSVSIQVQ